MSCSIALRSSTRCIRIGPTGVVFTRSAPRQKTWARCYSTITKLYSAFAVFTGIGAENHRPRQLADLDSFCHWCRQIITTIIHFHTSVADTIIGRTLTLGGVHTAETYDAIIGFTIHEPQVKINIRFQFHRHCVGGRRKRSNTSGLVLFQSHNCFVVRAAALQNDCRRLVCIMRALDTTQLPKSLALCCQPTSESKLEAMHQQHL